MKITALGVNAAFTTGCYKDVVSVGEAVNIALAAKNSSEFKKASDQDIEDEIRKLSYKGYVPRWQSNFLIEFDMPGKIGRGPYRLLLDAGGDIRHSLKAYGLTSADIDGIYISHPHNDHIGGMEYLALSTLFNPHYTPAKKEWLGGMNVADKLFLEPQWGYPPGALKPDLFVHRKVLEPLKRSLGPGLDTVQGVPNVTLETYFDIHVVGKKDDGLTKAHVFADGDETWSLTPIFAMHVISSSEEMASYGISLEHSGGYTVLMPTDTQYMMPPQLKLHYKKAHRIYMDCETNNPASGVHPVVDELVHHMDPEIQKKCLLYHYNERPDVPENMFHGILKAGDCHTYPE